MIINIKDFCVQENLKYTPGIFNKLREGLEVNIKTQNLAKNNFIGPSHFLANLEDNDIKKSCEYALSYAGHHNGITIYEYVGMTETFTPKFNISKSDFEFEKVNKIKILYLEFPPNTDAQVILKLTKFKNFL